LHIKWHFSFRQDVTYKLHNINSSFNLLWQGSASQITDSEDCLHRQKEEATKSIKNAFLLGMTFKYLFFFYSAFSLSTYNRSNEAAEVQVVNFSAICLCSNVGYTFFWFHLSGQAVARHFQVSYSIPLTFGMQHLEMVDSKL